MKIWLFFLCFLNKNANSVKEKYKSYNLRMVSVDNYCIFYTVDNDNKIVYVTNILYGKMNLNKHLTLEQ